MAEIRIERKRLSILPWILGLILLALLIWGLAESADRDEAGEIEGGAREVGAGTVPEGDIEPRFRQYAGLIAAGAPAPDLAAA